MTNISSSALSSFSYRGGISPETSNTRALWLVGSGLITEVVLGVIASKIYSRCSSKPENYFLTLTNKANGSNTPPYDVGVLILHGKPWITQITRFDQDSLGLRATTHEFLSSDGLTVLDTGCIMSPQHNIPTD
jgi:hypothetical protein